MESIHKETNGAEVAYVGEMNKMQKLRTWWGGSNEYSQSMFWAEIWNISELIFFFFFFFIWKLFSFWRWTFLFIWIGEFS